MSKKPATIAVLLKRSALELAAIHNNKELEKKIHGLGASTLGLQRAHEEHVLGLVQLTSMVKDHFQDCQFFYREDLQNPKMLQRFQNAEYVLTYGGDGTFLWAARWALPKQKLLAINSSPSTSIGFYCLGHVDALRDFLEKDGFESTSPEFINILAYTIKDEEKNLICEGEAINDILVSGPHPASSAKYWLLESGYARSQISSGVWVCTPLGSSGAVTAAGGRKQLPSEEGLQWVIRELYANPTTYRWYEKPKTTGVVEPGGTIEIVSNMRQGLISVDGDTTMIPFEYGMRITCSMRLAARTLYGRWSGGGAL